MSKLEQMIEFEDGFDEFEIAEYDFEPLWKVNIYEEALRKWGIEAQVNIAKEELAELIVAISHYFNRERGSRLQVAEEIADVEIICNQLRLLVGSNLVNNIKIDKLKKLRKRIGNAKKETDSD